MPSMILEDKNLPPQEGGFFLYFHLQINKYEEDNIQLANIGNYVFIMQGAAPDVSCFGRPDFWNEFSF